MRIQLWTLVALIALSPLGAVIAVPVVEARVRLDPPFAIISLVFKNFSASALTFDLGNHSRYLEYSFAIANDSVIQGVLNGTMLHFNASGGKAIIEVWTVFKNFKYEFHTVTVTIPAPLTPLEARECNFLLIVHDLPSQPTVVSSPFNVSMGYNTTLQHYVSGSTRAGPAGNLTLNLGSANIAPAIVKVDRTIIIDSERTVIIDSLTLQGLVENGLANITLIYSESLNVEGVGGLLGPYPPTHYSVTYASNATKVAIKLLAPPRRIGDFSYLWVKLSKETITKDDKVALPAFLSIGRYVQNLTVVVKVRGELHELNQAQTEGGFRIYRFPQLKVLGRDADPYVVLGGRLLPPQQPNYPLLIALLAALAAAGYLASARGASPEAAAVVEEVKITSELARVLKERSSNLDALLDAWSKYNSGRLGRQAYKQALFRYRRRESELKKQGRGLVSGQEAALKLLEMLDGLFLEIDRCLSEIEDVQTRASRGLITEKERRERTSAINEKLQRIRDEIIDLVEHATQS